MINRNCDMGLYMVILNIIADGNANKCSYVKNNPNLIKHCIKDICFFSFFYLFRHEISVTLASASCLTGTISD